MFFFTRPNVEYKVAEMTFDSWFELNAHANPWKRFYRKKFAQGLKSAWIWCAGLICLSKSKSVHQVCVLGRGWWLIMALERLMCSCSHECRGKASIINGLVYCARIKFVPNLPNFSLADWTQHNLTWVKEYNHPLFSTNILVLCIPPHVLGICKSMESRTLLTALSIACHPTPQPKWR